MRNIARLKGGLFFLFNIDSLLGLCNHKEKDPGGEI